MTSRGEIREAAREFLSDHPEAEPGLRALADLDADRDAWTFDDVELDSGRFGEVVSRDIAEKTDDGRYRLQHPDVIRDVLEADPETRAPASETTKHGETAARSDPNATGDSGIATEADSGIATEAAIKRAREAVDEVGFDIHRVGGLLVAFAIVAGARLIAYGSVFRGDRIVSPGNDPYYYRYWQAQLLERSGGVTDWSILSTISGSANTRPLTHATNWWLSELLGGTPAAADTVAAWLPVVGALGIAGVLTLFVRLLVDDVRIQIAGVAFLGVAPNHVIYTSLGFLEHRVHQYFWLGVLALTLLWLAVDLQRRYRRENGTEAARGHALSIRAWIVAGVLAISAGASAHAYGGSPLTFVPVAGYVALRVLADVREDVPTPYSMAPTLVGLGGGALLAVALHVGFGWHDGIAAYTPVLVFAGAVAVTGFGEFWRRNGWNTDKLLFVEFGTASVGLIAFRVLRPGDFSRLVARSGDLFFREGAFETAGLLSPENMVVVGPLAQVGLLFFLGFVPFVAVVRTVLEEYEPAWLAAVSFAGYYLLLAMLQMRFTAQFVFFFAPFAGASVVYILSAVDLARPLALFPDRKKKGLSKTETEQTPSIRFPGSVRQSVYIVATVLLLFSTNLVFLPLLTNQAVHSDEEYEAINAIDTHAEELDREYPNSFVLSQWGSNRMYNYHVNGESETYGYAQETYPRLLSAESPDEWYENADRQVGYVVVGRVSSSPGNGYSMLFQRLGLGESEGTLGHFQPIYAGQQVRVLAVVEGATIHIGGAAGENVTAATEVEIRGQSFPYRRTGTVEDGEATIRVANPGEYAVGGEAVTVSDDDIYTGKQVDVQLGEA